MRRSRTTWRWRRTNARVQLRARWGGKRSVEREEGVRGSTECDVVVEAEPGAPLEVVEPDLFFQLLIVALHSPAELGQANQFLEWGVGGEVGEPNLVGSASSAGHS